MSGPSASEPIVGAWYSDRDGLFEVVAVDDEAESVEIQYADGSLAEIDLEDWSIRRQSGFLHAAEPPEDLSASVDLDADADEGYRSARSPYDDEVSLRASGLDALDLFD